jgi:hypothetical protein
MVDTGAASAALDVAQCPSWAAALGYGGVAMAVCLSNGGAAVRTWIARDGRLHRVCVCVRAGDVLSA